MGRQVDFWGQGSAARTPSGAISFIHRLTGSAAFAGLFKEGMGLVEEAAAYLDGAGRGESRALPRAAALAYATESMRLTTRLMQVASWLLLQRAVNEGELSPNQAMSERHRVKITRQELACADEQVEQLPERLRDLSVRSLRIQARILHLDQSLSASRMIERSAPPSHVAHQVERLRAAFAS